MRKAIAGLALAGVALFGATACDSQGGGYQNSDDNYTEVEYGYYSGPTFIYYPTPRVVHVSYSYYHSHGSLFANPSHHSVPRGVTIGRSTTTTRTTRTTTTSGSRGTRSTIGGTTRTTRTTTTVGGSRSGRR